MSEIKKRMYIEKEGKEVIFFKDKKTGIIIRDFEEKDAVPYYYAMMSSKKLTAQQIKCKYPEIFKNIVNNRDSENDMEYSLVITTLSDKIIGAVDVKVEEDECSAYLTICLKDDTTIKEKGNDVINTVRHMHQYHRWFDEIFLKDLENNVVPLSEAIA